MPPTITNPADRQRPETLGKAALKFNWRANKSVKITTGSCKNFRVPGRESDRVALSVSARPGLSATPGSGILLTEPGINRIRCYELSH